MKPAPTTFPIHDLIRQRWSPRAFAAQDVAEETLHQLFEAASWAASANNQQPWRYIYARRSAQPEAFQQMMDCLRPGNQGWASQAPVLILALAHTQFDNGGPNPNARYDLGAANTTMLLEATALGLHGHQMAGFNPDQTREIFHLPAHLEPVVFIALGYLGAAEQLDDALRQRELAARQRRPVAAFAFAGRLP